MDYELARFVAAKAYRCSADLADLVPVLKEHAQDEDEYKVYARAIAHIVTQVQVGLLQEMYSRYPEIKREFEENLSKYQFVLY